MSDNISAPDPDGWAKEFVQTVRHVIPAKRRMPDPTALALAIVMAAKKKPARNGGWQETCIIDTDRPENVIPFIHDAARARKASDGADPQPGPFPPDPEQPGTPPQGDISDGPASNNRKRRPNALPYTRYDDIDIEGRKAWIFKGIMARGEISNWIGPPGSLKSSLMAEAAVHCSADRDWRGRRNKGPCAVVYFALERGDLVKRRLAAYRARGLVGLPIVVVGKTFSLMDRKCTSIILDTVHDVADDFGMPVGLVIIDTMAKGINAGGGDEDKAKDKGNAVANLRKVLDVAHVHIAVVGHTGKDETRGARGSNADLADADVQVQIAGDNVRTATVTKANDLPCGPLFSFRSMPHVFRADEDGDPIDVFILDPEGLKTNSPKPTHRKIPKALDYLRQAVLHVMEAAQPMRFYHDGPIIQAVQASFAREEFFKTYPGGDGDDKQRNNTRGRAWRDALILAGKEDNGVVRYREHLGTDWLWLVGKEEK